MPNPNRKNRFINFLHGLGASYVRHKTDQMAAALSFYAILSLPSLLILLISLGSLVVGQGHIKDNITAFIASSLDQATAQSLIAILDTATASTQQAPATIVSFLILIWTATALFDHLVRSFHTIWQIKEKNRQPIVQILIQKVSGFLFILLIDLVLLLVFFVQNALHLGKNHFPGLQELEPMLRLLQGGIGLLLPFLVLLFLLKVLARVPVSWKNAALGALITAVLLAIGNIVLGIYFQKFVDFSAFGAANTLLPLLVWIYYVSQIVFIGGEITYLSSIGLFKPQFQR